MKAISPRTHQKLHGPLSDHWTDTGKKRNGFVVLHSPAGMTPSAGVAWVRKDLPERTSGEAHDNSGATFDLVTQTD